MCLCLKQYSLFSYYALPSGGKSKGAVVHWVYRKVYEAIKIGGFRPNLALADGAI